MPKAAEEETQVLPQELIDRGFVPTERYVHEISCELLLLNSPRQEGFRGESLPLRLLVWGSTDKFRLVLNCLGDYEDGVQIIEAPSVSGLLPWIDKLVLALNHNT